MKRLLNAYRFTRVGSSVALVLAAALLVLLLGPRHDRAPALIVIVIGLAVAVWSARS